MIGVSLDSDSFFQDLLNCRFWKRNISSIEYQQIPKSKKRTAQSESLPSFPVGKKYTSNSIELPTSFLSVRVGNLY